MNSQCSVNKRGYYGLTAHSHVCSFMLAVKEYVNKLSPTSGQDRISNSNAFAKQLYNVKELLFYWLKSTEREQCIKEALMMCSEKDIQLIFNFLVPLGFAGKRISVNQLFHSINSCTFNGQIAPEPTRKRVNTSVYDSLRISKRFCQ